MKSRVLDFGVEGGQFELNCSVYDRSKVGLEMTWKLPHDSISIEV